MRAKLLLIASLLALSTAAAAQETKPAQRLAGATGWLNSPPVTDMDLRGKVVLVDFWTYTCVNWLRTLPYVRAWSDKYKDQGLVVIGVHTPEFPFEKDLDNVQRSVKEMRVAYPVALDSNYAVWRAFANNAWPAVYLVDPQGRVRYSHLGEGEYEATEKMIQQLLSEAGQTHVRRDLVAVEAKGLETAADWPNVKSPETYLGSDQTQNFASPGGTGLGERRAYSLPGRLALNYWALAGSWTIKPGFVVLNKASGRIAYRFHARDVNLVMGPEARGKTVRFRVLIDGK
ncbi:MAG TPA: redoxin family protein, partial [Beijerinckiaceae bacterium]|nr:redoxin family protein [Beijerinckiaceae bacterium]